MSRSFKMVDYDAALDTPVRLRDVLQLIIWPASWPMREKQARRTGRQPRGRPPTSPGSRNEDQYNFTGLISRIMKNPHNAGLEQHYNAQTAVEQDSRLIIDYALSNHASDQQEALPLVDSIPPALGTPAAAALDAGSFNAQNVAELK